MERENHQKIKYALDRISIFVKIATEIGEKLFYLHLIRNNVVKNKLRCVQSYI